MLDSDISKIKAWLGSGAINIFGRPFAGKDTQCKVLAYSLDGNVLGGGEILRGQEMPQRIKDLMKTGELIPTEDYIDIVLPRLSRPELTDRPLILSSVGRWRGEEDGVIQSAQKAGHPIMAVFHLQIDEATVRQRWSAHQEILDRGHRHDDNQGIIDIRLREFNEKTLPVIDTYRDLGLLYEINGDQNPEDVTSSILEVLLKLANLSS